MQDVPQRRGPKPQSKNLLNDVFFKYLPYWPLFIITLMIAIPAGWFYLRTAVPQYDTRASIMLKDESKGAYEGIAMGTFDRLSDKKIIENELKVIQSKTLLYDVVKRQHLYAEFFEKGEYKSLPAYVTSPVRIEAQDPDALKSAKEVLFTYNEKDSTVQIGPKKFELNKFEETEWGTIRFVLNHKYAYKAQKPLYFTLQKARNAADGLGMVKAIIGRETTVIEMTYTNADPTRGEDILNELIRSYDRANVDEKNRLAINTEAYVRERLDSVQREIDAINGKKTTYKSSRGAQDLSEKGALFLKTVTENDQRVGDVNIQLSVLNQVEKYVKSKDNAGGIVPSTLGVKDPMLGKLVEDLYDTEINYDKVKKTSGENNPITLSIKDKMDKMRPGILENINNQRNNLEATKSNLNITSNTYNSMLSSIPQQERDLIDIDRELTIKLGIYNFLRQRLEESALAHSNIDTGARIVDPAQSTPFPVSPNGKMIYIVAFIFGLGLPAGFIAVKEMLNRKVMFRAEIEKLTSVPIIGEVIHDKGKTPLVILEGKRTFIAEQFRRIRTSLTFLGINSQKKKILITSSLSGEGKSFVATNLALSLALAGKKVVLVEFDLANPSLSKKLNVNYEKGASTYLWGEAEPEEIIKRTAVNENLFFIPSGPLPDNPSELLMSDRVRELIEYLEAIFDTIIIDSAPANLLSDAYVLSPMCDATLFVVKHKYTPKMNLERLDEEDGVNQLKNLGIIFNGIRSRGFTKNGYGYGYGYGYIQNNEKKKKKKKEYYKDE